MARPGAGAYESYIETSPVPMWIQGFDEIWFANDAAASFFGFDTAEELHGESSLSFVPEAERDRARERNEYILEQKQPVGTLEGAVQTRTGKQKYARFVTFVTEYDGEDALVVTVHDVTNHREYERQLTRQNQRLRAIFEDTTAAIVEYVLEDGQAIVERVNGRFEEVFDCDGTTVVGHPLSTAVQPPADDPDAAALSEMVQHGASLQAEVERVTADGVRTFLLRNVPIDIDEETRGYAQYLDITEHREREAKLEAARKRYRTLLQAAPDPVFVADAETGEIIEANHAAEQLRGQPREEIVGQPQSVLHPDGEAESYRAGFERAVEEGGTWSELPDGSQLYAVTVDGERIPVEISVDPIELDDTCAVYGIFRDITERKERERELKELKNFNQELVEHAPIGLFRLDENLRIVYENPRAKEIVGVPDDMDDSDAIGTDIRQLPSIIEAGIAEKFGRLPAGERIELDFEFTSIYGREGHLHGRGVPLFHGGTFDGAILLIQDIGERKERERQLQILDRMLRHNLHNDMNVIRGRAETIRDEGPAPIARHAQAIVDKSDELITMASKERTIDKLLQEDPEPVELDVASTVERAVRRTSSTHPKASIVLECPDDVTATAVPQFETAIAELIENGVRHSEDQRPEVAVTVTTDADDVRIEVADDGPGIPEMEQNILTGRQDIDPLNHSRGLGLWLVYWIVHYSTGSLDFGENEPHGSVVVVELQQSVGSRT